MRLSVWYERSKRTGRYSVRYYDPVTGQKAPRIKCVDRQQMLATVARIQSMLLNQQTGRGDPDAIPLVVFEDYLNRLREWGRRETTINMKRGNLKSYLESVFKMSQITSVSIRGYIEGMRQKYKTDTIAIRLRDLRAWLNYCVKEKIIMENPFKGIQIPISKFEGRRINGEEIGKLLVAADPQLKPFLLIALETGARHGELLKAEWKEVDLTTAAWFIPASKCKTRINRTIPLSECALTAFKSVSRRGNRVFEGMSRFQIQRLWKRALRAAGITDRVRVHDLRHTFASNWRGRAASLKLIAGWTTDAMLSKYTHTELAYLAEEVKRTSEAIWGGFGANEQKNENAPINNRIDKI